VLRRIRENIEKCGGWLFCLLFLFSLIPAAQAAPLARASATHLSASLEAGSKGFYRLSLRSADTATKLPTPNVMLIDNPTRLVIDVPGVSSKSAENVSVKDALVSGLRIGVHPDKTRIVVDIQGHYTPQYQINALPDGAEVVFSFGVSAHSDSADTSEESFTIQNHAADEEPTPAVEPTPKPRPTVEPLPLHTPEAVPTPGKFIKQEFGNTGVPEETPAARQTPQQNSSNPADDFDTDFDQPDRNNDAAAARTVTAIYYQTLNNTKVPAVAFDLKGEGPYSLKPIKSDLYELVLKSTRLAGKYLSLPQFPPDSFRGFSVIVARQEGADVHVKIYVEENTKLFPFISKGQLWLKVSR
jgi:hypothetical protein